MHQKAIEEDIKQLHNYITDTTDTKEPINKSCCCTSLASLWRRWKPTGGDAAEIELTTTSDQPLAPDNETNPEKTIEQICNNLIENLEAQLGSQNKNFIKNIKNLFGLTYPITIPFSLDEETRRTASEPHLYQFAIKISMIHERLKGQEALLNPSWLTPNYHPQYASKLISSIKETLSTPYQPPTDLIQGQGQGEGQALLSGAS